MFKLWCEQGFRVVLVQQNKVTLHSTRTIRITLRLFVLQTANVIKFI